jgi:hypothetical protein
VVLDLEHVTAYAAIGTAVGTLALAIATYFLAKGTRADVAASTRQAEASTEQAKASLRQAEESSRHADLADRALRAQTTPLLADVPYGVPKVSGYAPMPRDPARRAGAMEILGLGPHQPHYRDASELYTGIDEGGDETASLSVPVRNIGLGAAVITSVEFRLLEREPVTGLCSSPVVPHGEVVVAELEVHPKDPRYTEARRVVEDASTFSVVVAYSDANGEAIGAVRLDVHPIPSDLADSITMAVRQVFWGRDRATVMDDPTLGSQPAF